MQVAQGLGMNSLARVIVAGGSGALGIRIAANFAALGHEVFILTRKVSESIPFQQVAWDGRTIEESWANLVPGSVLVNLSGELVDRRPTPENIDLLKSSRVVPTKALVEASKVFGAPSLWLQMSTLAIYGDAGELRLDETSAPADGPEQMAGVARVWEEALQPIEDCRMVFLRTGIVLDRGTPALNRLVTITKMFLGGSVASGKQWVSWIHIDDLVEIFQAMDNQTLDQVEFEIDPRSATTIMVVSGGYPEDYEKGKVISGLENVAGSIAFHAGTALKNGEIVTNGGRVIAVTSYGDNFKEAIAKSYANIEKLQFEGMYYRKDIGFDL